MSTYKIEKQYFANVTPHQREAMLAAFEVDDKGDIVIPYEHKGYTVNDLQIDYRTDVKASRYRPRRNRSSRQPDH